MIISAVQQSDSVIHVHTSILFHIFSHIDYCRIMGGVPCTTQKVPVILYITVCRNNIFKKLNAMSATQLILGTD